MVRNSPYQGHLSEDGANSGFKRLITDAQEATANISPGLSRHREFGGASCLSLRLDANAVIDGALDFLLATKVALCGLHRDMPE